MTNNTINNVPRELLERACALWPDDMGDDGTGRIGWLPHVRTTVAELRAILSAPSPAGVDGCKCSMSISMLGDGCRHCQPQEYIDRIGEMLDEERDQQAQRIGELEGLLREVAASLAWNAHGECRAIHEGPIMPSQMALDAVKVALGDWP